MKRANYRGSFLAASNPTHPNPSRDGRAIPPPARPGGSEEVRARGSDFLSLDPVRANTIAAMSEAVVRGLRLFVPTFSTACNLGEG